MSTATQIRIHSYSNMNSQLLEYLYVFTTLLFFMGKKLIGNLNRIGKNAVLHGFYFVCTYVQYSCIFLGGRPLAGNPPHFYIALLEVSIDRRLNLKPFEKTAGAC